jgi:hypothetical protein
MTDEIHRQDLERDVRIMEWKRQAKQAARARQKRSLYIITLHPDVLDSNEFRQANPGYVEGMPCVYVGLTIHKPGDRYQQHKAGYRSSKYPRLYGIELAMELMEGFDAGALKDTEQETALADWLRDQGLAVWQN